MAIGARLNREHLDPMAHGPLVGGELGTLSPNRLMVDLQGASTKYGTLVKYPLLISVRGGCPDGVRGANDLLAVGSALKIAHVGANLVLHSTNSHAILGHITTEIPLNRLVLVGVPGCGRSMWGVLGVA